MDRADLNWGELPFDYIKTDCHLEHYYRDGKWHDVEVVEDDKISISMSSTCLHYGQECFEGTKVFETKDGRVLAFRPEMNAARMRRTADRLMMPGPTDEMFVDAVTKVVQMNRRFIPPYGSGAALYIRPLLIGITGTIGIKPSREYLFCVFCTPVGPYFRNGLKPIKLRVEEHYDRSAPNGLGNVKAGGNYAAGLVATYNAKSDGFAEVLYVDPGRKQYIDESGASNFFAVTKDGTYVTPDSDSILLSITNDSLMTLAKDLGIPVEKRPVHIEEIYDFVETGCVGTAAIITPVEAITYRDKEIRYLDGEDIGPVTKKLYDKLTGIQSGDLEDTHGWTHEITFD